MSEIELLADEVEGRLTVAVVRGGIVDDLYVDDAAADSAGWGAFYLGKVIKIDTRLQCAVVDLGDGQTGLLPAKHVRYQGADSSETRTGIADLLHNGQMIVVQVKSARRAESAHENEKMPRLTMKLYMPGVFLAYSPASKRVTISRKIESEKTLALTAQLKGEGGWIVRAAAEEAAAESIESEAHALQAAWQQLLAEKEARGDNPGLLKRAPNAAERALFDYDATAIGHIHAGNREIFDLITAWCAVHLPPLATSKRLRLFRPEKNAARLFERHDVYGVLEALEDQTVLLPSGASLVIERTAAMTVIDVNQGAAAGILSANLEAASALARQCRLRNLSGTILVDFINMDKKEARGNVLETLADAAVDDPAGLQVHGFTRLGMAEITRRRRTASLAETLAKQGV